MHGTNLSHRLTVGGHEHRMNIEFSILLNNTNIIVWFISCLLTGDTIVPRSKFVVQKNKIN